MLTCFSSKFICSTLVFLYSKDVVFLGLTFETVLGRSLLQECCILLFQLICCVWFSGASSFWWRSFFGLALSEWCLFPIPLNEKVYWPKMWFRFCCFWGIRNQRYFILTDFASLSKATLEEIHSLIVPGLCRSFAFLTCFPGNDDSGTLSEFSGKLPLHCTLESVLSRYLSCFIFLHETVLAIFWRIEIRDTHLTWVSFSARFGCFLLPSKCGSLFFNFILTV